jgi:hypothetical protein
LTIQLAIHQVAKEVHDVIVAVVCLVVVLVEHIEVFELAVDNLEHIVSFVVVVGKSVAYHRTLN